MAVEFFEDCRIETLLIREYPGLRRIFLALHPVPGETECDPETTSCLRHRLAMLSYALLDPRHPYTNPQLLEFVARFHEALDEATSSTREMADLALSYVARTRRQSDQLARVHFDNTVIDYRDDNRHLWQYIEDSDDEEFFDDPDKQNKKAAEVLSLPPRRYPEWDCQSQTYRPDWASVYEALHPSGNAADIDRLLEKHAALAKRLKRLLDLLKPQDKVRIRYQEEGSDLDLDIAISSLIDYRSGATPDPRINMSHRTDDRSIRSRNTSIVDGEVQATEVFEGSLHRCHDRIVACDVCSNGYGLPAVLADLVTDSTSGAKVKVQHSNASSSAG
jgi:hypothetical protein